MKRDGRSHQTKQQQHGMARTVVEHADDRGDEGLVDRLPLPLPRDERQERGGHLALDLVVHLFSVLFFWGVGGWVTVK